MEKKRRSAKILRDRKRMARYFHTHGYGRLADGYAEKKDENVYRVRIVFAVAAAVLFAFGLYYVIF